MDKGHVDTADGSVEYWIYNQNGVQIGHMLISGITLMKEFDQKWNKTTIGGNRRYGIDLSNMDLRQWVDDFIVNDSQIGPTYFSTLHKFQNADTTAPAAPSGLQVQ